MLVYSYQHIDVENFHDKFGLPMPERPTLLGPRTADFRTRCLLEEVEEFRVACESGDMHGAADALVDLVYFAHGTAVMMGLPWGDLWDEVQRANMSKVRAASAAESKRGSGLDVVKPNGWTPPDHTEALGTGPWPTLEDEA